MTGESGARPVFTRIESAEQLDFLRILPDVLLQGRAIAPPSVSPDASRNCEPAPGSNGWRQGTFRPGFR